MGAWECLTVPKKEWVGFTQDMTLKNGLATHTFLSMPMNMPRHSHMHSRANTPGDITGRIDEEIRSLEADIKRLEAQVNGRRQELADALNARKWVARVTGREPDAKPHRAPRQARTAKKNITTTPSTTASAAPKPAGSMASIIRDIVREQTGEFSVTNILRELRERYPDVAGRLPPNYCGIQLWKLGSARIIEVVRRGEKGLPNVYVLPNSKNKKAG